MAFTASLRQSAQCPPGQHGIDSHPFCREPLSNVVKVQPSPIFVRKSGSKLFVQYPTPPTPAWTPRAAVAYDSHHVRTAARLRQRLALPPLQLRALPPRECDEKERRPLRDRLLRLQPMLGDVLEPQSVQCLGSCESEHRNAADRHAPAKTRGAGRATISSRTLKLVAESPVSPDDRSRGTPRDDVMGGTLPKDS
jgi:hypothetical protein